MADLGHLYLMQNNFGLIKIGRSVNPPDRRRKLEATEQCEILTVAVIENAGSMEEEVLMALDQFRLVGEWFSGESDARHAVLRAMNLPHDVQWPFELTDAEAANDWLDELESRRWLRSVDREYGRLIREMTKLAEAPHDPSRWWDVHIWSAIWRFEYQVDTIVSSEKNKAGETILVGYRRELPEMVVPAYTTDIDASKQLWPEMSLPAGWLGSSWESCIAGLQARRLALSLGRLIQQSLDMIS